MQRSGISDALVCSWPPPIPTAGTARLSDNGLVGQRASQCGPPHSPDEKTLSRDHFLESTSTWDTSEIFSTEPTPTMTKPIRTAGWKCENVLQPIRSRTHSVPSVRRPPEELWRSDSGDHESVDTVGLSVYPTPPGLPPPRPELRRAGSTSDLLPHGSVSLSLALGSQPLRASEHTKAVPPIGAERSRVISITSFRSSIRNPPATQSYNHSKSPGRSLPLPPSPQAKWKNDVYPTSPERVPTAAVNDGISKEELERLLRHAVRNKYAPKVVSPLSPLRTSTPASSLSTDPTYKLRMPSQLNTPSPRYSNCPPKRARTYVLPFPDAVSIPPYLIARLSPSLQGL